MIRHHISPNKRSREENESYDNDSCDPSSSYVSYTSNNSEDINEISKKLRLTPNHETYYQESLHPTYRSEYNSNSLSTLMSPFTSSSTLGSSSTSQPFVSKFIQRENTPPSTSYSLSSSTLRMEDFSGYENVCSMIKQPQSLIHQANHYIENVFGIQGPNIPFNRNLKVSSRQAVVVISHESDHSLKQQIPQVANLVKPLSRAEIYAKTLRENNLRNRKKKMDNDEDYVTASDEIPEDKDRNGEDIDEDYDNSNHLATYYGYEHHDMGSQAIMIFYEVFWSIFVLFVAVVIILLSFTQLLVLLPFLICYRIYGKFNDIVASRAFTFVVLGSSLYYAHKYYILYCT